MTTHTKRDGSDSGLASYTSDTTSSAEEPSEPTNAGALGLGAINPRTLMVVAVALSALVRIAWTLRHGFAMEQEGVEYARIAENLRAGRGYMGMFANGTPLNFPPALSDIDCCGVDGRR